MPSSSSLSRLRLVQLLTLAGALLVGATLHAGGSSSLYLVPSGGADRKNAVVLEVPAEVLAFQVQIFSPVNEWEARVREVDAARAQLKAAAEQQGFRLVATQAVVLGTGYGKSLSFSSAGRSEIDVQSSVLLVADLNNKSDLVELVRRARLLLTKPLLPKGVTLGLGEVRLGLEDPEKFRSPLLVKIREHLDMTAAALGASIEFSVSGLDEPVTARQTGERNVEISLPLRVTYARKTK